jgi:hypothetical protein
VQRITLVGHDRPLPLRLSESLAEVPRQMFKNWTRSAVTVGCPEDDPTHTVEQERTQIQT